MSDPLGLIRGTTPGANAAAGAVRPGQSLPGAATREADRADDAAAIPSFKNMLLDQLREVNQLERQATEAIEDLKTGKTDDFEAVFSAQRKAELALDALLQVRNKVMDAYNEVKQIRV